MTIKRMLFSIFEANNEMNEWIESSQHSVGPSADKLIILKGNKLIACPQNFYLKLFFNIYTRSFSLHVLQIVATEIKYNSYV